MRYPNATFFIYNIIHILQNTNKKLSYHKHIMQLLHQCHLNNVNALSVSLW